MNEWWMGFTVGYAASTVVGIAALAIAAVVTSKKQQPPPEDYKCKIRTQCMVCKRVCEKGLDRRKQYNWVEQSTWEQCSHGYCPRCYDREMNALREKTNDRA